jgi:hypothetical protein
VKHNNSNAADGRKSLVLISRLSAAADGNRWAALAFSNDTVCNHSICTKTGKFTSVMGKLLYRESILPINVQAT